MFNFQIEPDGALIKLTQTGYWSMDDFKAFERAFLEHHRALMRSVGQYRVLAECQQFPVQSVEIGEAFQRFSVGLFAENTGRYAIVAGSMLNKLQAKRALPQAQAQAFLNTADALAWLNEPASPPV